MSKTKKEIIHYPNGQKYQEKNYKDGEKDGKWTTWYENGQKWYEGTYKDGKMDGLWTGWYENGLKESERTFKDDEQISIELWDEDENEKECN